MASRPQVVTGVPTALVGIAAGVAVDLQNLSTTPITVANAPAAPGADAISFSCGPLEFRYPEPAAGEFVWVWIAAPVNEAVVIAYEESA